MRARSVLIISSRGRPRVCPLEFIIKKLSSLSLSNYPLKFTLTKQYRGKREKEKIRSIIIIFYFKKKEEFYEFYRI